MCSDGDTVKIRFAKSSRRHQGGKKEVTGVLEALIAGRECGFRNTMPDYRGHLSVLEHDQQSLSKKTQT